MGANLYVHVPFCRAKCRYCALYSRTGESSEARQKYVRDRAEEVTRRFGGAALSTVYFGGGSPALCDLRLLFAALRPLLASETEFTVELHPNDVSDDLLRGFSDGGVNRISMGLQSLEDATLARMGRGYTVDQAHRAFDRIRSRFDNVGIDLIVGFPGDPCNGYEQLADWGLSHASLYALQNERGLQGVPDDDWTMDHLRSAADALAKMGLNRYEISNYATAGRACRHNRAVWRGEDYIGLGEGAYGREGLFRTRGMRGKSGVVYERTTVTPQEDLKERTLFRLRTDEGMDASRLDEWSSDPNAARDALCRAVREGLLQQHHATYTLTRRGTEVCDAILADLV